MKLLSTLLASISIFSLALMAPAITTAAEFHSGQTVTFSPSDSLTDAYIAGNTISINAPVTHDLVVAGNTVNINGDVENSLIAAGGTVTIDGNVGHSLRAAGGTIIINGHISRDVVVFGGEITLTSTAIIDGDLIVNGGTITIDSPVNGKVIINGGQVHLNSTVGSVQDSHVSKLTLGSKAIINGSLHYQAPQEADMATGATVKGQTDYQKTASRNNTAAFASLTTFGFFYNIIASLIFGFVLLYLLYRISNQAVLHLKQRPLPTLAWGLGSMFLFPILAIVLTLLSAWLGITSFIFYVLCMVTGYFLAQLLLGWWLLDWWFSRTKESYHLDWRAVIIGVLATTVLMLVPVIGWLVLFLMLLFALGSLAQQVWSMRLGA